LGRSNARHSRPSASSGWRNLATSTSSRESLRGRVAVVTGAGRGLGKAVALGLARSGADLALVARTATELEATAAEAKLLGVATEVQPTDVSKADAVDAAVASVLSRFGTIDILVNAAGTSPYYVPAERLAPDDWDRVIATNLRGVFLCCRAVGTHMLARGGGAIVNVTSVLASNAVGRLAAYSASKAGVEGLTRALAVEWAERGVRVNAVAPGFIRTAMTQELLDSERHASALVRRTPMRHFGDALSVVAAVLYLVSTEARYVTGSTVFVDGGWNAG
jgi:NAD(P)-dependent dehydrogenase (short-subunit alcohol dehydrogenase family)